MSARDGSPPLRIEGLTVRYGQTIACRDVSLSVPAGSVYALLGRNGAGKSSLVRCVLGQQRPAAGKAFLFGQDVWLRRAELMKDIGIVPEEPDAPAAMTATQIADFCGRVYSQWDSEAVRARLQRFGVPPKVPFGRLSKGEKGAIMLSLALGHSPRLLVLDDPTLGLDAVARRAFYDELVGELADRGTTVFLTTHDLSGVEGIATRIGIVKEGRMVLDEEMETLKSRFRRIRYGNQRTETRSEYGNELDKFEALRVKVRGWGVEAVVSNFDDAAFESFRATDGVVDAEVSAMPLEEIFLAVAGEEPAGEKKGAA